MTTEKAVYLKGLHVAEVGIAAGLKRLLSQPKRALGINTAQSLERIQRELNILFAASQLRAWKIALSSKGSVVTGGPGSGKTTTIRAVVEVLKEAGQTVLLGAPTGRAAKRMSESTGHEARTLHRLLAYSPTEDRFKKNEHNTLEADFVVVDEMSMVDTSLMYRLLKAMPIHASLLMLGDADQLSSVGPGNVLRDIIDSGVVPTERLEAIFRQKEGSMIISNAYKINRGLMPLFEPEGSSQNDFRFVEVDDDDKVLKKIVNLCTKEIPDEFGIDRVNDIQVLTPVRKGLLGTVSLNSVLQGQLNPAKEELQIGGMILRQGDKVMQTENNYVKNTFNGDVGRIVKIDNEIQEVRINYGDKIVAYDYAEIDELTQAYSISVHKSQGSEYPVVILPVSMKHYRFLQRCLIYTAVTRAKKLVVLVGQKKALRIAIQNDSSQRRFTHLKSRLRHFLGH
jgi:exodeoxyribonuclease V alpha subunit